MTDVPSPLAFVEPPPAPETFRDQAPGAAA